MNSFFATKVLGDSRVSLAKLPERSFHTCVTSPPYYGLRSYLAKDHPSKHLEIGSEPTFALYLEHLIEVLRAVRRVLRDDGTVWLNLGDRYTSAGRATYASGGVNGQVGAHHDGNRGTLRPQDPDGLKKKDLCLMPMRVAMALQDDGWYLRALCPWIKRNCVPESAQDRPASALEYFLLLAKSQDYFYDRYAVMVGMVTQRNRRNTDWFMESWQGMLTDELGDPLAFVVNPRGTVLEHFAAYPPELVKPCILASTSEMGCCRHCGAQLVRIVRDGEADREHQKLCGADADGLYLGIATKDYQSSKAPNASDLKRRILAGMVEKITAGWTFTCNCPISQPVPCTVLDPFHGSGSTAEACTSLGRRYYGCELNEKYLKLSDARDGQGALSIL